jgi:hypothetical protein
MPTSTSSHDLTAIKHALELGFILAAIVLAIAAHGYTRQSQSHTTPARSIVARCYAGHNSCPARPGATKVSAIKAANDARQQLRKV